MGVAAAGYLPPVSGALLQEVIDVGVILNALRAAPAVAVAAALATDLERGLSSAEAAARLARFGPNRPRPRRRPPYVRLALGQLLDPLVALLLAATAISVAIGDTVEGAAIGSIVVLNGLLGFWQEIGAERAIRALSQAFTQTALVVRDGAGTNGRRRRRRSRATC